jgi:hypothetical protein
MFLAKAGTKTGLPPSRENKEAGAGANIDCSASLNMFRHASKRTLCDLRDIDA